MGLVFTNYSTLAKADLSGWYFDSKTSVCSSSLQKYKAMASEFLALFVFEKYFRLIFHKCSKIFFEGITPRKGPLSTILERAHAMKFTPGRHPCTPYVVQKEIGWQQRDNYPFDFQKCQLMIVF